MSKRIVTTRSPALIILILSVMAALVLVCSVGLDIVLLPHDGGLGRDFSAFYAAGLTLRHGLDPYNWSQIGVVEAHMRSIGDPRQPYAFNAYANPPLFAAFMRVSTSLTDQQAYVIWVLLTAIAVIVGSVLVMRSYGVRGQGWATLLFLVTPVPAVCLFLGQQTPLLLLGLGATLAALRAERPALAGMIGAIGWIKPHLLFPLLLFIIAMLGWRVGRRLLAGFISVSALLGAISWLTTGGALFVAWGRTLVLFGQTMDTRQPLLSSLAGLYLSVVGRPWSHLGDPRVRLALCAILTAPEADLLGFRPNYVLTYSVLIPLTLLVALRPWQALRGNPRGASEHASQVNSTAMRSI